MATTDSFFSLSLSLCEGRRLRMLSTLQNPRSLSCFPLTSRTFLFHTKNFPLFSSLPVTSCALTDQALPATSSKRTQSQILSIRRSLLSRQITAVELVDSYLTRLRITEPLLKSFLHVSDQVLKQAREIDEKILKNENLGPLAGVLVAVKDNICTADMPSTGGSRVLEGYRPPFDATAVRKIKELGGIVVGKTNLDEFGMGSTTESSAFQVTANPWDVSRVPGGSSGGSAVAVSARQCVLSLGSDTGGSVRQPASFCGVVGLKPTYGRVSRFGLMAFASSLDVIGCFGTSVVDVGILLSAISGHDSLDATSSKQEVPDFTTEQTLINDLDSKPLKGLRIGLVQETLGDGVDAGVNSAIHAAASHLKDLGCIVKEISLPSFSLGLPAYYILASSEASSNLACYDGVRYGYQAGASDLSALYKDSRAKGFGSEVKRRILTRTYALSAGYYDAYYKRTQQMMFCSVAATSVASSRLRFRPLCLATNVNTEQLREQLDQLHSEAESTRGKANNARLRLLRLSEAAEKFRRRATISVQTGKDNDARELLLQKKKVVQALEKSKSRIELLDDLSSKLNEAISIKENQLIRNIALDLESSSIDLSSPVRIVSPKQEANINSDYVKSFEVNDPKAPDDQDWQSNGDNRKIISINEDLQFLPNEEIKNGEEVISSLKGISSYEEFLEHLDKQLNRIEIELVTVLRVATLVMDDQTNWKLHLTKELLDNIRSTRQRLIGIEITKVKDQ